MKKEIYVYIDMQNVFLAVREDGWHLDWERLIKYLLEKYQAKKVYLFLGYLSKNRNFYQFLKKIGYTLVFKQVQEKNGKIKANIDAELVLQTMLDIQRFDQAIIITNDGDFTCLIKHLESENKLKVLLSPNLRKCSSFLRTTAGKRLRDFSEIKHKLKK